jgi:HEAT repeat protein
MTRTKKTPPIRNRKARGRLRLMGSFLACVLAGAACLLVFRWMIVPSDTGRYKGHTAAEWIELLGGSDIGLRTEAAQSLEEMGERALPRLGYALRDPDVKIRRGAVMVLYEVSPEHPSAAEHLARALKDPDRWVRWRAAKGLRRMGPAAKPAVLKLAGALRDDDPRVRLVAAQALGRIGQGAIMAHPALIEAMSDSEYYVRQAASAAITRVAPGL